MADEFKKNLTNAYRAIEDQQQFEKLISDTAAKIAQIGPEKPDEAIDAIYERTHGFPREVLRVCNNMINEAIEKNEFVIRPRLVTYEVKKEKETTNVMETLTPMQRRVIELLKNPLTPGQLADMLDLGKYKTRQHAVRSVNNVLKTLLRDNLVERTKEDKAYIYHLAPRVKTLVIKS